MPSPPVPEPDPAAVAAAVLAHYRAGRRALPWRETSDPYAIWVSEIMLQQTRVATVIPYYERWLERFPNVEALAAAPLDDVLARWAGLGYYRRARNLHRGAAEVVARWNGRLPRSAAELREVPGIGRYTAGAIASIAYGAREPVVDGNVIRVLARVYDIDDDVTTAAAQKKIWALAGDAVPAEAPGDFNQGLMELGATVCTPTSPTCLVCPLAALCRARARGRQDALPVKPRRKKPAELPLLALDAAWVARRGRLLLARRRPEGLYGGLWELPAAESVEALRNISPALRISSVEPVCEHSQTLSHRRLRIRVRLADAKGRLAAPRGGVYDKLAWYPLGTAAERGVSSATAAIVARMRHTRGEREA